MTTNQITEAEAYESHGRTIVGSDGEPIGEISEIYLDDRTQKPEWATVATAALGGTRFVPLAGAASDGDAIRARVTMEQVQDAPSVDPDRHVSEREEARLFEYYGIPHANRDSAPSEGQSDGGRLITGPRLRRYAPTENLTPVVGSVRTTRWTTADDRAGAGEPAAGKSV
jgi:sporulation protein YlmC with PRC-barrel domain